MLEPQELTEAEAAAWDRLREAERELTAAELEVMEVTNRAARRRRPRHLSVVFASG
jgi:predicted nucleic acid-binding protein